jgi:hypothetical protein
MQTQRLQKVVVCGAGFLGANTSYSSKVLLEKLTII